MTKAYCNIYNLKEPRYESFELILNHLPKGVFKKIVIKPNWVKHNDNPNFTIDALITSTELIASTIEACLKKYKNVSEIVVCDTPIQSCNWDLLLRQAGIDKLIDKYKSYDNPVIKFLDLRTERYSVIDGFLKKINSGKTGDPKGYYEIILDKSSFLDAISHLKNRFRVSDYEPNKTISNHHKGFHRYLISGSVLDCDLFINMPKMKTHQKAGITGALKNLVGINVCKEHLVHYRCGLSSRGGDEFPPNISILIILQVRIREFLQKRSRLLFSLLRKVWKLIRNIYKIEIEGTPEKLHKTFYVSGGSWYGNDTVWRMIYDLNKILLYAATGDSKLRDLPQRAYIAILDGIVSGEGNGPLQPLPVKTGILAFSNDPFLMDMAMAQMMGFDYQKIPQLSNFSLFKDKNWALFNPENIELKMDEKCFVGIRSIPVIHNSIPPPGWKGHIEIKTEG